MSVVSLDMADPNLSLLKHVASLKPGDRIVLCRGGRPEVEIRHCANQSDDSRKRNFGEGVAEVPDSFFEPLPDDIIDAFYTAPILSAPEAVAPVEHKVATAPPDDDASRVVAPALPDDTDPG